MVELSALKGKGCGCGVDDGEMEEGKGKKGFLERQAKKGDEMEEEMRRD